MQLEPEPIHDSNRYPDSLCVMLQCWIKSTQSTQLQLHLRCKLQQFKDSSSGITPTPGISSLSMSSLIPVSPNFRRLEGPKLAHLPFHEDIKHFGSWRLPQDWGFTSTLELLGLCVQGLRASRVLSVLPNTLTQVQAGREHRILLLLASLAQTETGEACDFEYETFSRRLPKVLGDRGSSSSDSHHATPNRFSLWGLGCWNGPQNPPPSKRNPAQTRCRKLLPLHTAASARSRSSPGARWPWASTIGAQIITLYNTTTIGA